MLIETAWAAPTLMLHVICACERDFPGLADIVGTSILKLNNK